jgi:hypothetical protein
MAESLYVCLFSNYSVKVGRSIDPKARVAMHADRVACVGIELSATLFFECVGPSIQAEAALIRRCTQAATAKHKNEWFDGLDYEAVCDWARECAYADYQEPELTGIHRAVAEFGGPTKIAAALGNGVVRQHVEHWLKGKGIPPEHCHALSNLTGLPLSELRPNDWQRIWPTA